MEFVCDHAHKFSCCQGCPDADPHPYHLWNGDGDYKDAGDCRWDGKCLVEDSDGSPLDILVRCIPVTKSHDNRGQ